ncbi:uncharacterized protein [Nicotiana sylvestris]|uniref:Uncharacterized protein isoform X2 n=2 Tax=Nicotiana TaxID=4085 RepID=A0A1S3Z276_TOBAC|nr:PREDICTED: uncharacterized protein LOC104222360 isoform X2 [Nicotiana sylvestris]XP_016458463.1 PREDICTED: uncharacterized protein LOC107782134 isoform X2 [Nicotiana tabacum]
MDGLSSSGLQDIFETQVCESMKGHEPEFSEFFTGIGKFVSVIFILIFRSWFEEDVNTSRLDKYYAILMIPAFLNFLFCWFLCCWYLRQPYFDSDNNDAAQELEDGIVEVLTNENTDFDIAQELEDAVIEVLTKENTDFDIAQELEDAVMEVLTKENSGFDIGQELEDGIIEILTSENSSLTPSTNN